MINDMHGDIAKHAKTLMFKEPFYGLFLISLNKEISDAVSTACVAKDGINTKLVISPKFWDTISDPCKVAVLKHELLHIAFKHLQMFDDYSNKEMLNVAADLEINQYIEDTYKDETWEGLEITNAPWAALNLPVKAGTRKYYELIQQEIDKNPDGDISQFIQAMKDANGDGQSRTITLGDGTECEVKASHEFWKQYEGMDEAEKKLMEKQIEHQLKDVADQVQKQRGHIPGELKELIDSLYVSEEPVIDWRAYLRRFNGMASKVFTKKTRRKPNKRFYGNPALKIKQKKNTLVAIDTSGSVSKDDLKEFLSEIHHIWKTGTQVTVVECDAHIGNVYEYTGQLNENYKVSGRGGTSYEPVMRYLKDHKDKYQNLIYLTDGECSIEQTQPCKPVLWVHCSGRRINNELPGAKVQIAA
jgi:predicted metal-dependent peptidase